MGRDQEKNTSEHERTDPQRKLSKPNFLDKDLKSTLIKKQ